MPSNDSLADGYAGPDRDGVGQRAVQHVDEPRLADLVGLWPTQNTAGCFIVAAPPGGDSAATGGGLGSGGGVGGADSRGEGQARGAVGQP